MLSITKIKKGPLLPPYRTWQATGSRGQSTNCRILRGLEQTQGHEGGLDGGEGEGGGEEGEGGLHQVSQLTQSRQFIRDGAAQQREPEPEPLRIQLSL